MLRILPTTTTALHRVPVLSFQRLSTSAPQPPVPPAAAGRPARPPQPAAGASGPRPPNPRPYPPQKSPVAQAQSKANTAPAPTGSTPARPRPQGPRPPRPQTTPGQAAANQTSATQSQATPRPRDGVNASKPYRPRQNPQGQAAAAKPGQAPKPSTKPSPRPPQSSQAPQPPKSALLNEVFAVKEEATTTAPKNVSGMGRGARVPSLREKDQTFRQQRKEKDTIAAGAAATRKEPIKLEEEEEDYDDIRFMDADEVDVKDRHSKRDRVRKSHPRRTVRKLRNEYRDADKKGAFLDADEDYMPRRAHEKDDVMVHSGLRTAYISGDSDVKEKEEEDEELEPFHAPTLWGSFARQHLPNNQIMSPLAFIHPTPPCTPEEELQRIFADAAEQMKEPVPEEVIPAVQMAQAVTANNPYWSDDARRRLLLLATRLSMGPKGPNPFFEDYNPDATPQEIPEEFRFEGFELEQAEEEYIEDQDQEEMHLEEEEHDEFEDAAEEEQSEEEERQEEEPKPKKKNKGRH